MAKVSIVKLSRKWIFVDEFPFFGSEKIDVKGDKQHPLYAWLTDKEKNGTKNSSVKWNFQKYLLNEKGELIDYYYSITKPMSSKILNHLK